MEIKRGIPVSPGIAIGPALVLDNEGVVIAQRTIPVGQETAENSRLHEAMTRAATEARARQKTLTETVSRDVGNIFQAHAVLFEDEHLRQRIADLIRTQHYTAEYAVTRHIRSVVKQLEETGDPRVVRMRADFLDVEKQVLAQLIGSKDHALPITDQPVIVLASDLTPSETAQLNPKTVFAFATESGGATSHTAIMADALEIPAVVGIGRFISEVSGGDIVIVDGTQGLVILEPDEATLQEYQRRREAEYMASSPDTLDLRCEPALTRDGREIRLMGNIEFPSEASHCLDRGAVGVGLYRTEFLYVNKSTDPTEEEHFEAYRTVLRAIGDKHPVVVRTLDIGADKFSSVSGLLGNEKNPFLGLRSVRLCLKNLPLFKTQLRAILRASIYGDLRIMFPMISTVMELRQCKSLLAEIQEDLEEAGIPFNRKLRIGTMIEVPSAALMADVLAREVDFFSIGTNDLVQYTLAADRNNENVGNLYNPADPSVIRLIRKVVNAGNDRKIEVNVCGEMSGEAVFIPLLIGLGLRHLSCTPRKIPEVKRIIRNISATDAERIMRATDQMETAREIHSFLREQFRRLFPGAID
jgi:phosphoenolpyruvate-protein phosphotransferase (PTS system enzyme I)